jgi:CheY-like chemotaxis protein
MDHMMPDMDGVETTRKLREMGYKGAIVALTANALVGSDEMFKRNGFDGFVSKPIDVQKMDAVLKQFIRDGRPAAEVGQAENQLGIEPPSKNRSSVNPRLLEIFRKDAEKAVPILRETVAVGDIKLFTITVHAMKSALANVGENEKSKLAAALESAGCNDDWEYIRSNTGSFIEALETLIESLCPAPTPSDGVGISEDTVFLKEQLESLRIACEAYDVTAADSALDRLKNRQWKADTADVLDKIYDDLLLGGFEQAAERARRLIDGLP